MNLPKLKKLIEARTALARLEATVQKQLNRELVRLPARYGFDSAQAFADALIKAAGAPSGAKRGRKPGRPAAPAKAAGGGRRRKRAKITDETRKAVGEMVAAGQTGSAIAKALKISLPSVQNIKKALGLVKAR
ncbi:MAG: helix-turn-helix domain-containing protein [Opitutaceae bacterium]